MSLKITKAGILDTVQDLGRYGYQHLGINPAGAMDKYSAQLANALLGKIFEAPVLEMHFPASRILFEKVTVICITGADFSPMINEKKIPLYQAVVVNINRTLHFKKAISGARCYISVLQNLDIIPWLKSFSTNLKAETGGFNGRALKQGDELKFQNAITLKKSLAGKDYIALPWKVNSIISSTKEINFVKGNEWEWLTDESKKKFFNSCYLITKNSDRMGYRLKGEGLCIKDNTSMISSAVSFGTVQLLPNGQLIILMADHQTTGGYPRIAHVTATDVSLLAQKKPGDEIKFAEATQFFAEQQLTEQKKYLLQLQTASKFNIEKLLNVTS